MDFRETLQARKARERRYKRICQLVGLHPQDRVLDVGCGQGLSFEVFNHLNEIVGLDLNPIQRIFQDNFQFIPGDAASMQCFEDGEFDVVVCIGVLPRIVPYENLRRAAREIARVGRAFVVVVPHILTFIDPYTQLPLGQFSPRNFQAFSQRCDSLDSHKKHGPLEAGGDKLFYLRAHEWQSLFPESTIVSYRYMTLGFIRNFIIYKRRAFHDAQRELV